MPEILVVVDLVWCAVIVLGLLKFGFPLIKEKPCLSHDDVEPRAGPGGLKTSAAAKDLSQRPDIIGFFLICA